MSMLWSNGRQLTSLTKDNKTTSYTYDTDGMRLSKTVDGVKYTYLYEGGLLVQETRGSKVFDYSYDANGRIRMVVYRATASATPETYYYALNSRNDVIGIYTHTGKVFAKYDYDVWGNLLFITNQTGGNLAHFENIATLQPFRYRSYYYDTDSGFYYLQSRYYDPLTHRFINADTQLNQEDSSLGYNMFTYCNNNPVNQSDPDGHLPKWAKKLAIAAAVVVAVAVVATICVATAGAGSAIACVAIGAAKGAAIGFAVGAATGAASGAVSHRVTTGSWKGAGNAALNGMADGALSGAITGAITGGITSNACFIAGTTVVTSVGYRAIENICAGDEVCAEDPETGEKALKEVVQTFVNETKELVHVFVDGEEIVTTPEHPFYVSQKGWASACELRVGDILVSVNGEYVIVEKIQHEILEKPITVYNFEVEDFHTYYVGENSILVHNTCGSVPTKDLQFTHKITRSKGQMRKFIQQIQTEGIQEPIKYVEHNGLKYIVDGHHRVAAARALKIAKVPAQEVSLPYAGYKTVIDLFD